MQLMTVILVRHHVTVNLKCPSTDRQRRPVFRLYLCCNVQHDSNYPLTGMEIGRFNQKEMTFCLHFVCWRL